MQHSCCIARAIFCPQIGQYHWPNLGRICRGILSNGGGPIGLSRWACTLLMSGSTLRSTTLLPSWVAMYPIDIHCPQAMYNDWYTYTLIGVRYRYMIGCNVASPLANMRAWLSMLKHRYALRKHTMPYVRPHHANGMVSRTRRMLGFLGCSRTNDRSMIPLYAHVGSLAHWHT